MACCSIPPKGELGKPHVARRDYCVAPTPKWKLNATLSGIANQILADGCVWGRRLAVESRFTGISIWHLGIRRDMVFG